jgi:hypothetical protein
MAVATMASLPPDITTMTAILAVIALTLALSQTKIGQWGGGRAVRHLICHCHGCRHWCHLCLHSQDNSAKDNNHGDRQGHNPDIHGREEVGYHDPIGVEQQKQKQKQKKSKSKKKINNSGGNVTASTPADSYARAATAAAFV